jgi:hypothetical protein
MVAIDVVVVVVVMGGSGEQYRSIYLSCAAGRGAAMEETVSEEAFVSSLLDLLKSPPCPLL